MRLLLDTQALLLAALEPERLSERARAALTDIGNSRFLSDVACWELAIKAGLGKLPVDARTLEAFIGLQTVAMRLEQLTISRKHVLLVGTLPHHHRDPFDRLLVAQLLTENLVIVSGDEAFDAYGVQRLW